MRQSFLDKHIAPNNRPLIPNSVSGVCVLYDFFIQEKKHHWKMEACRSLINDLDLGHYTEYHFRVNEVYKYQKFMADAYIGKVHTFVVPDLTTILSYMAGKPFINLLKYYNIRLISVLDGIDTASTGSDVAMRFLNAFYQHTYHDYAAHFEWNPETITVTLLVDNNIEEDGAYTACGMKSYITLDRVIEDGPQLLKDCGFITILRLFDEFGPMIRPERVYITGEYNDNIHIDINYFNSFVKAYETPLVEFTIETLLEHVRSTLAIP